MNDEAKEFLEICKKCDLFFKKALDEAVENQHLQISQEAAFYLLSLLLMEIKRDPNDYTKSLAEKYLLAQYNERASALKAIGDSSLILAGIWWQSLLRKLVDVDYYMAIGSHSYKKASEITPKNLAGLFEELSDNFGGLVNVIAEATRCISEASTSDGDILRMYEVWLRTHNTFLGQKLKALGIDPVPDKTTKQ